MSFARCGAGLVNPRTLAVMIAAIHGLLIGWFQRPPVQWPIQWPRLNYRDLPKFEVNELTWETFQEAATTQSAKKTE